MENEIWRSLRRFPGCKVSNRGRLKKENGTIISPQIRKGYFVYEWKVRGLRRAITVATAMREVWPKMSHLEFRTREWAERIRAENYEAKKKESISWGPLDYYPGCKSPDSPQYCPMG